ncbi:coiled-coil-helix-coiled-coil-helix domain-containing protein 7-like [Macrobrachium nipponense]|uniref:coiled-coil-helix-coiled-coil-helix domain-containing protein 7-like n=1 Tax=Macrobrachium nipponense TaxID=159736 RepID=UPI0030C88E36
MFSGVVREPSKTEEERLRFIERTTKLLHDEKNPCTKEHNQSYKCLEDNDYDRNMCAWYFENYKRCKEFWNDIRVQRRRAGIVPNLPPLEEREEIKRQHMERMRSEANK